MISINRDSTNLGSTSRDFIDRDFINRDYRDFINRDSTTRDSANQDSANRDSANRDSANRDFASRALPKLTIKKCNQLLLVVPTRWVTRSPQGVRRRVVPREGCPGRGVFTPPVTGLWPVHTRPVIDTCSGNHLTLKYKRPHS